MSDFNTRFLKECKARGLNPASVTNKEMRSIAVSIRTPAELARDGLRATKSLAKTAVLGQRDPELAKRRLAVCGECEHFVARARGCTQCTCSGGSFQSKLQDTAQTCPHPGGNKWQDL